MKFKRLSWRVCFTLIGNLILVFCLITIFVSQTKMQPPSIIDQGDFIQYMEDKGCSLADVQEKENYSGVETYLVTSKDSCPYLVSYTVFNDQDWQNNFFVPLRNEILNEDGHPIARRSIEFPPNYLEYSASSDDYKIVTLNQNSVLYASADSAYKTNIITLFKTFNYYYSNTIFYILGCFLLVISILFLVSFWKIEKKIRNKGWVILIPFYNIGCLAKDIFGSVWYALLLFVPIVNFIFLFVFLYETGKVFKKSNRYCIGLMFLPTIFLPLLAFDDSKYNIDRGQNETKHN